MDPRHGHRDHGRRRLRVPARRQALGAPRRGGVNAVVTGAGAAAVDDSGGGGCSDVGLFGANVMGVAVAVAVQEGFLAPSPAGGPVEDEGEDSQDADGYAGA